MKRIMNRVVIACSIMAGVLEIVLLFLNLHNVVKADIGDTLVAFVLVVAFFTLFFKAYEREKS
jgi:membrane protease YdiL (CAAX protease family)